MRRTTDWRPGGQRPRSTDRGYGFVRLVRVEPVRTIGLRRKDQKGWAMAALCPCGCGKKLSLIQRGGGTQVRVLDKRIEWLETVGLFVMRETRPEEVADFEDFIAAGREFRNHLIDVIHGDLDARYVDRRRMNAWAKLATRMERGAQTAIARHQLTNP